MLGSALYEIGTHEGESCCDKVGYNGTVYVSRGEYRITRDTVSIWISSSSLHCTVLFQTNVIGMQLLIQNEKSNHGCEFPFHLLNI
jgi:hypothetical protein